MSNVLVGGDAGEGSDWTANDYSPLRRSAPGADRPKTTSRTAWSGWADGAVRGRDKLLETVVNNLEVTMTRHPAGGPLPCADDLNA